MSRTDLPNGWQWMTIVCPCHGTVTWWATGSMFQNLEQSLDRDVVRERFIAATTRRAN